MKLRRYLRVVAVVPHLGDRAGWPVAAGFAWCRTSAPIPGSIVRGMSCRGGRGAGEIAAKRRSVWAVRAA